jgi:AraC-like DNA-binding protein
MHDLDKTVQARGIYIYCCRKGLVFWACPLTEKGTPEGTAIAGGVFNSDMKKNHSRKDVPAKTEEEIESLARMLRICASQSSIENDFQEIDDDAMPELGCVQTKNAGLLRQTVSREWEREALASLHRGDTEIACSIIKEFLDTVASSRRGDFAFLQSRAIEMAAFFAHSAADGAEKPDSVIEGCSKYMARLEEATTSAKLYEAMISFINNLSADLFSYQGVQHQAALRKAGRFIWANYTRKISLDEISKAAGLSAPYFSMIFKKEMGENLSVYLNRLRVEKAKVLLQDSDISLFNIAKICGFEDQSWFSKIFKAFAGISPGKFRAEI